jgi:hypothetical protein
MTAFAAAKIPDPARTERVARRFCLREENAVLLFSKHRNQVPLRVRGLRLEVEAGLVGRLRAMQALPLRFPQMLADHQRVRRISPNNPYESYFSNCKRKCDYTSSGNRFHFPFFCARSASVPAYKHMISITGNHSQSPARWVHHFSPLHGYTPGFLDGVGYTAGKSDTPQAAAPFRCNWILFCEPWSHYPVDEHCRARDTSRRFQGATSVV